jgi:hypothetical protein
MTAMMTTAAAIAMYVVGTAVLPGGVGADVTDGEGEPVVVGVDVTVGDDAVVPVTCGDAAEPTPRWVSAVEPK